MQEKLSTSLFNLEEAFFKTSKDVHEASNILENELAIIKNKDLKDNFSKENIDKMIATIEKLSIQSDYKLSILKDFSKYISNKK